MIVIVNVTKVKDSELEQTRRNTVDRKDRNRSSRKNSDSDSELMNITVIMNTRMNGLDSLLSTKILR